MDKRVKNILELINKYNDCYIVGGYVRDYLLGINSNDYDICTSATIDKLKEILYKYKYTIEFNTMHIKFDNINIDITPYRKEYKYNKRKPILYYDTNKLEEDLIRRDFTINTICMDSNNNILDILNGKNDIDNKVIKCVGNIDNKLTEDPLRILRAFRFSTYLNFRIDEELENAIKKYGYLLKDISYEIKKRELDKIIEYKGLDIIKKYNLEKYLDIDLSNIKYYKYNILTWMNIDYFNKYCITRKEKKTIKLINELSKTKLDNYDLYTYGLDICNLVGEYMGIDLKSRYDKLPIKCRKDILVSSYEILNIVKNKRDINNIYILLEKNILMGNLINDNNKIIDYLSKNYDRI